MSDKKSGQKTGRKPGTFTGADDPRRGRGPKPGTGGRPPNAFKERMRELSSLVEADAYLVKCLKGEFGPKFFLAAKTHVDEHGYGKATQFVETIDRTPYTPVDPGELRAIYALVLGRQMSIPEAENYIRTNPDEVKLWLARQEQKKAAARGAN